MAWYEKENPNDVTKEDFLYAIQLAEKCKPEHPEKIAPKVGVVVVKNGKRIAWAHRNLTGSGDHAEFIALEERGVDKVEFKNADLITTLEPCTEKRHGKAKKACAEWVKLRRIRKVWIGTLDLNPQIRGKAVTMFHLQGVEVGWFPDDLVPKLLELNQEFFKRIQRLSPGLTREELEARRMEIKGFVDRGILEYKSHVKGLHLASQPQLRESVIDGSRIAEAIIEPSPKILAASALAQTILELLQDTLNLLMVVDVTSSSDWMRIGWKLLMAYEAGMILCEGVRSLEIITQGTEDIISEMLSDFDEQLIQDGVPFGKTDPPTIASAARAFDTSVRIDWAYTQGVLGKAWVEFLIDEYEKSLITLESVQQNSDTVVEAERLYAALAKSLRRENLPKWHTAWRRAKKLRE